MYKRNVSIFFCLILLTSLAFLPIAKSLPESKNQFTPIVSVYFSPNGGCTEAIVNEINKSTKYIKVQAYSFTSKNIAQALIDAKKRGIVVEAVLDKSNRTSRYSAATFLLNVGIPTLIDDVHAIAHNKIIIIDDEIVITGSFNFSRAAEEVNAENLVILKDKELAKVYLQNYEAHKSHSKSYSKLRD